MCKDTTTRSLSVDSYLPPSRASPVCSGASCVAQATRRMVRGVYFLLRGHTDEDFRLLTAPRRHEPRGRNGRSTRPPRQPGGRSARAGRPGRSSRYGAEARAERAGRTDRDLGLHRRDAPAEGPERRPRHLEPDAERQPRFGRTVLRRQLGIVRLHPRHRAGRLRVQPRPRRRRLPRWRVSRAHHRREPEPARRRPHRDPQGSAGHALRPQHHRWRDQHRHAHPGTGAARIATASTGSFSRRTSRSRQTSRSRRASSPHQRLLAGARRLSESHSVSDQLTAGQHPVRSRPADRVSESGLRDLERERRPESESGARQGAMACLRCRGCHVRRRLVQDRINRPTRPRCWASRRRPSPEGAAPLSRGRPSASWARCTTTASVRTRPLSTIRRILAASSTRSSACAARVPRGLALAAGGAPLGGVGYVGGPGGNNLLTSQPRIFWNFANTQTGDIDRTYATGPSFAKYDAAGTSITVDLKLQDNLDAEVHHRLAPDRLAYRRGPRWHA